MTGLYYLHESIAVRNSVDIPPADLGLYFTPVVTTDSRAAFAQGTYHITNQINLTVGGRYTEEDKELNQNSAYYPDASGGYILYPPPGVSPFVGPVVFKESGRYSAFTPKVWHRLVPHIGPHALCIGNTRLQEWRPRLFLV